MKNLAAIAILLALAQGAWAEPTDLGISTGPCLVLPVSSSKIFDAPYPGLSFKWRFLRNLAVGLDFLYAGEKYFYYDQLSGSWYGPGGWDQSASGGANESDWIFYQDKFLLDLLLYLQFPLDRFDVHIGTGPALLPVGVSDASEYYPDFASAFDFSRSREKVFVGYLVKTGVDLHLFSFLSVNADLMFEVDRPGAFVEFVVARGFNYILSCSSLVLGVNLTL